jgi:hypothetical protein
MFIVQAPECQLLFFIKSALTRIGRNHFLLGHPSLILRRSQYENGMLPFNPLESATRWKGERERERDLQGACAVKRFTVVMDTA